MLGKLKHQTANKVYVLDGILRIDVVGDQTGPTVKAMGEDLERHIAKLRQDNQPVLILDNLQQIGHANAEALRYVAILARILDYDRAVMVGDGSEVMCTGTNLLLKAVGRANTHYFSDLSEAEAWLRVDKESA